MHHWIISQKGDEEWDNIIDMEQGDVPNENYHRDFLMKHFAGADSMLKSVMSKAKIMSERGKSMERRSLRKSHVWPLG